MGNYFYTVETNFYGNTTPEVLLEKYGSPLYVYNESIFRERCREMKKVISYPKFTANFSIKANSNLELLKIVREEGLYADAMSPGEIFVLLKAGFKPEQIFYVSNNVSKEEMEFAIERGITVSIDSVSQLKLFGSINPGGSVSIRFNPGIGAGHHEKVVTAGKKTKFGIGVDQIDEVKKVAKDFNTRIAGINQHIGSLFMEPISYVEAAKNLLSIAEKFADLDFIDFGGGFGIPYRKQDGEKRLNLGLLNEMLSEVVINWVAKYGKQVTFKIEPGRYIAAESGVLLGRVHAVKQNSGTKYIGTDLGFNVLARPVMYDAWHDIEIYRNGRIVDDGTKEEATIVGNICESGDIIAKDRMLPVIKEGDICGVMDVGAYGYSMSSNYNNRLQPAEVLIKLDGSDVMIRRRGTLEDLMRNYS
jgi:diaminopimelate decarboxylase